MNSPPTPRGRPGGISLSRCSWLLNNSASDENAKAAVAEMTLKEVEYCLKRESRATAIRMLESRRRMLERGARDER